MASLDLDDGQLDAARERLAEGYRIARETRDMPMVSYVGVAVARLVLALDRPLDAALLLGAAARLRGADDRTALDVRDVHAALGAQLDAATVEAQWQRGWQLTVVEALDALRSATAEHSGAASVTA